MCIKNRAVALLYRIILVIGCGYGILLTSGITKGSFSPVMFVYYTVLSNLVCLIYFIFCTVHTITDIKSDGIKGTTTTLPKVKGGVVMMITVTMLIYHFMLAPQLFAMNDGSGVASFWTLSNILVHYFTPLMVIFDWLLFDKKNSMSWYAPITWLSIPLLYFGYALLRAELVGEIGQTGSRYPYFFINVDTLGWGGVLQSAALIAVGMAALGYIIYAIDKIEFFDGKLHFGRKK